MQLIIRCAHSLVYRRVSAASSACVSAMRSTSALAAALQSDFFNGFFLKAWFRASKFVDDSLCFHIAQCAPKYKYCLCPLRHQCVISFVGLRVWKISSQRAINGSLGTSLSLSPSFSVAGCSAVLSMRSSSALGTTFQSDLFKSFFLNG